MSSLLDLANSEFEYEGQASYDRKQNLLQQLRLLTSTRNGSVPLDRDLGLDFSFVDRPIGVVRSLYAAQITEAISKYIPSLKIVEIKWSGGADGHFYPRVVVSDAG